MNTEEIAEYLGFSPNTIRAWVKRRCVPFIKLNGGVRFDMDEINSWVMRNRQDDINECEALNNGGFSKN